MPGFDIGKYVFTVIVIGIFAGGLMWAYDQLAPTFNDLIAQGMVSHIGVQTMQVLYFSIVAYAPINLIFASIQAILVANARAESNSPFVTTDISPHVVLAAVIIASFFTNFIVCVYLDTMFISTGSLFSVPALDPNNVLSTMFNAAHLLCVAATAIAYLYVILASVRIESLQWSI